MKQKTILMVVLVAAFVGSLSACSAGTSGALAQAEQIVSTCPGGQRLAEYIAYDASGSGKDVAISEERQRVIATVVNRVVICGGHLRVVAFSAGSAATALAYDSDLQVAGATEISRLRKAPAVSAGTSDAVLSGLVRAASEITPNGSDITSQFELATEYARQLSASGGSYQLDVQVLTDGVQNAGVNLQSPKLTIEMATDLANGMTVPTLPSGTTLKLSGIGITSGAPASTAYVDSLKAFYLTFCKRTGASCQVVSDFAGNGADHE